MVISQETKDRIIRDFLFEGGCPMSSQGWIVGEIKTDVIDYSPKIIIDGRFVRVDDLSPKKNYLTKLENGR